MNERQLQSFILSANHHSFSKAAQLSYISTPALVQQINLLETSIGFKLFNRTHHGISLTPSGEVFYDAAKKILTLYENAVTQGQNLEKQCQDIIKIAYPFEKFPIFLLKACEMFYKDFPNTYIEFVPLPFKDHIMAIYNETIDLSVIAQPADEYIEGLTFYPLYEDTYSFCMRPQHPLSNKKEVTVNDLKDFNIIVGKYDYLKTPFKFSLPHLIYIDKEYDLSMTTRLLASDEMIVIHSSWEDSYKPILKTVKSNINAGKVGVLYRSVQTDVINQFLPYIIQTISS